MTTIYYNAAARYQICYNNMYYSRVYEGEGDYDKGEGDRDRGKCDYGKGEGD